MLLLVSIISAAAPMLFYMLLLWWFDKYDREPFKLVLLNFLWGAVGAVILALIASSILSIGFYFLINDEESRYLAEAVIIAPFVEEITKGVFLLITIFNKKFDNLTDGLVYGGAIGLGFGMTENFLYFISFSESIETLVFLIIIRSLFSAVMHCLSTASLGAFMALTRFSHSRLRFIYPLIGLLTAMLIHFIWNLTVSFEMTAIGGLLFIAAAVLFFMIVYYLSIRNEKKIIIQEITDEINRNNFPEWVIRVFDKRHSSAAHDLIKNQKLFRRSLTTLAFRKSQLKFSSAGNRSYYEKEIENHRLIIQNLCNNS